MMSRLYFAYGSNINLNQMAVRCPDATVVEPVTLENYRLAFRAGGVATIIPENGSKVEGLLWNITPECEQSLDAYEGFPKFYGKENVKVMGKSGQEFEVMAYRMTPEFEKQHAYPAVFYSDGIRAGYMQNGMDGASFDKAYDRAFDEATVSVPDKRKRVIKGRNNHER